MTDDRDQVSGIRHRIAVAAGTALPARGLMLVMFVLPVEFGIVPVKNRMFQ